MSTDDINRNLTTVKQVEGFELFPALVNLLAEGQPVAIDRLAAAASWSVQDVEAGLHQHPSVEWDEEGRLVGFGMTLRPTPHRFTFDGSIVFGWCASDALMFSVLLDTPWIVESTCPVSGQGIRADVTPRAVLRVEPPDARRVRGRGRVRLMLRPAALLLLASTRGSRRTPEVGYRAHLAACPDGSLTHWSAGPCLGTLAPTSRIARSAGD